MAYKVKVTQTVQKIIEVTADSPEQAVTEVSQGFANGSINFNNEDVIAFSIRRINDVGENT